MRAEKKVREEIDVIRSAARFHVVAFIIHYIQLGGLDAQQLSLLLGQVLKTLFPCRSIGIKQRTVRSHAPLGRRLQYF